MITITLTVLAFVTVAVKYVTPIIHYVAERLAHRPIDDVNVMWDFWWPVYLLVALHIHFRHRRAWSALVALVAIRVLWSVITITFFVAKPAWDFWALQWLFYEGITAITMVCVGALALSPVTREQMGLVSRPNSMTA